MKCDDAAVGYSKESDPKVLWTIEGLLEQLCGLKGTTLKGIRTATP
jgi:hypothetical protein